MAYNFTDKNGLLYVITKIKNLLSNYLDLKLDKAGDSKDNTVTFTSGDSTNPTGWADINLIESGETHSSLFRKFSLAIKNMRYLYKILGTTDISNIGDGTATGAISTLDNDSHYVKISTVVDSNGNQLPPSSFRDSALSIGYSHGSYFGLEVTAYIPIITMRWYDSSENIRTIQYALSGITTYTRYSVSPTEWSNWTSGATKSQIDSINSSLSNKIKVTTITGSTGTGGNSGSLNVPRTEYPNAIAIIPIGYDTSLAYRVSAFDISSANFRFGVQVAVSGAWANAVTIAFKALVFE